jgi:CheY-like chemotaxis protein
MDSAPAILVVDDEAVNRRLACTVLRAAGWTVDGAVDGPAALAALRDGAYALVLMDIQMPGMDGFDATQAIRASDGPAAAVPIVAFTALRRAESIGRMWAVGMDGHVAKPFTPESLVAAVEPWRPSVDHHPAERLAALFGAAEIASLLGRFRDQLSEALVAADEEEERRARAHKIAGIAGTLGFPEVSRTWLAVSEGLDSSWEAARVAARKALTLLATDRYLTPNT